MFVKLLTLHVITTLSLCMLCDSQHQPYFPSKQITRPQEGKAATKAPSQQHLLTVEQTSGQVPYKTQIRPPLQHSILEQNNSAPTLSPYISSENQVPGFIAPGTTANAHSFVNPVQLAQMHAQQQQMMMKNFYAVQQQKAQSLQFQNQKGQGVSLPRQERQVREVPSHTHDSVIQRESPGGNQGVAGVPIVPTQHERAQRSMSTKRQTAGIAKGQRHLQARAGQAETRSAAKTYQGSLERHNRPLLSMEQMKNLSLEQMQQILSIANERKPELGQALSFSLGDQAKNETVMLHGQKAQVSAEKANPVAINTCMAHLKPGELHQSPRLHNATRSKELHRTRRSQSHVYAVPSQLSRMGETNQEKRATLSGKNSNEIAEENRALMPTAVPMKSNGTKHIAQQFQNQKRYVQGDSSQPGQNPNPSQTIQKVQRVEQVITPREQQTLQSNRGVQETNPAQLQLGNTPSNRQDSGLQRDGSSREIGWTDEQKIASKVNEIQNKYGIALQKYLPLIQRMKFPCSSQFQAQFSEQLKDCCVIMSLSLRILPGGRVEPSVPQDLNLAKLVRIEAFLQQVMLLTAEFIKKSRNNGQMVASEREGPAQVIKPASTCIDARQISHPAPPSKANGDVLLRQDSQQQLCDSGPSSHARDFQVQQAMVTDKARRALTQSRSSTQTQGGGLKQSLQHLSQPRRYLHQPSASLAKNVKPVIAGQSNPTAVNAPQNGLTTPAQASQTAQDEIICPSPQIASCSQTGYQHPVTPNVHQDRKRGGTRLVSKRKAPEQLPSSANHVMAASKRFKNNTKEAPQENKMSSSLLQAHNGQEENARGGTATGSANKKEACASPIKRSTQKRELQRRFYHLGMCIKQALSCTEEWKSIAHEEAKRSRRGRVQSTFAALCKNRQMKRKCKTYVGAEGQGGVKIQDKLNAEGVTTNEKELLTRKRSPCRSEVFKAVTADCQAVRAKYPSLQIEVSEKYGLPVVTCKYANKLMRLPSLVLHVEQGYPGKGVARYGFERSPMGWMGPLEQMRQRFKKTLASESMTLTGVEASLLAWADAVATVIKQMRLSDRVKGD